MKKLFLDVISPGAYFMHQLGWVIPVVLVIIVVVVAVALIVRRKKK